MVWLNPSGEKALMVHTKCVRRMFIKAIATSEVKAIDNLVDIRKLFHGWYERIIRPEYALMSPVEDGDVQMWDNWSVSNRAIDSPYHYRPRSKRTPPRCYYFKIQTTCSYTSSQFGSIRYACWTCSDSCFLIEMPKLKKGRERRVDIDIYYTQMKLLPNYSFK